MDKRPRNRIATKFYGLVASVAFLAVAAKAHRGHENVETGNSKTQSDPDSTSCRNTAFRSQNRFLMLVSTLDGKISALNVEKDGGLEWSISTGSNHLLSSSISNLEVNRDGRRTRLIPSLDGGLYQFDGDVVEPVPFNADTLLSSSFRLNDHSIMVGGKESETYGIDLHTGGVKYVCDMDGCRVLTEEDTDAETSETLVIHRTTRTVRAVEMINGAEKWNFSVGEHELKYISISKSQLPEAAPKIADESRKVDANPTTEDDGVRIDNCEDTEYADSSMFNFPWWNEGIDMKDIEFKVIVPKGLVVAVLKSDPTNVVWQHQFDSAIAKAWTLREGELQDVDLFDSKNVPALSFEGQDGGATADDKCEYPPQAPAMYIGTHDHQFYVQPSVKLLQEVERSINEAVMSAQIAPIHMPRVTWKPYIASSPSRTPAETRNPLQVTWERGLVDTDAHTAVSMWCEYPYDVGYYVFPDTTSMPLIASERHNGSTKPGQNDDDFYFEETITVTLWNWWREVLAISVLSSIMLNIVIMKVFFPRLPIVIVTPTPSRSNSECDDSPGIEKVDPVGDLEKISKDVGFQSRYESDFEQVACLGKGGFGVVFHTKNKVDDVDYAVKRITLTNSDKAKEKVMREVKALAKLEHGHIVRYHQAWFECPPSGWQEERDQSNLPEILFSPTPAHSGITETTAPFETDLPKCDRDKSRRGRLPKKSGLPEVVKTNRFNPLKPFGHGDFGKFSNDKSNDTVESIGAFGDGLHGPSTACDKRKIGSTEPFSPQNILESSDSGSTYHEDFEDESELTGKPRGVFASYKKLKRSEVESSCEVVFSDDVSSSNVESSQLPFKHYNSDSSISTSHDVLHGGHMTRTNHDRLDDSIDIVFENSGSRDNRGSQSDNTGSSDNTGVENEITDSGHVELESSHDSINDKDNIASNILTKELNAEQNTNATKLCPETGTGSSPTRPSNLELVPKFAKEDSNSTPVQKLYLYIQMQLCKKHSLKEWLSSAVEKDTIVSLDIFGQIVSAVEYVHDSGLMHRDLKPSNIFFSMDGTVKVGDFGLVTALEEQAGLDGAVIARTPSTAYFRKHTDQVGTKLYMSPEQIEGKSYSHKVDIFALGLILFELFSDPFVTQMERIHTMLKVKRRNFPAKFSKACPQQCELAQNLLSPKADDRLSATDILNHTLLTQHDLVADHSLLKVRSRSRSRTISQSSGNSSLSSSVPKDGLHQH